MGRIEVRLYSSAEFGPGNKLEFRRSRERRRGDDDDAKTVQSEVKARVAIEAIRGEDAEPIGIAIRGTPDADRQVAEGGAGATAGAI